jgi:drug/metabolite transporter (DMT)-like permease
LLSDKSKRDRKIALLEGITAGTLFGTAAILIKLTNLLVGASVRKEDVAFFIALWRLIIASLFMASLLIFLRRPFVRNLFKKNLPKILVLGILLGLHFILFVSAVLDTTILNATVLVNTTPIWSMFVSSLVFKLKPSRLTVLGILISFFGVGVIAYGDASSGIWTINLKGDLEAIFAAVIEAFYLSYGRDTRHKTPLLSLMLTIYVVSASTVLVGGVVTRSNFILPTQLSLILALIGLGLLPTALAHTFYFSSLSHLKSFETASMALLEPIGATLLGILIFAQIPNPMFVLCSAFVLVGILSVALSK